MEKTVRYVVIVGVKPCWFQLISLVFDPIMTLHTETTSAAVSSSYLRTSRDGALQLKLFRLVLDVIYILQSVQFCQGAE